MSHSHQYVVRPQLKGRSRSHLPAAPAPRGRAPAHLQVAAAACLTVGAALSVVELMAGDDFAYTRGFAPPEVALVAMALGLLGLMGPPARLQVLVRCAALVLLLWCGAGVLFDLLRAAAALGVPGLPPEVDLLGLARRGAALVGAALLASTIGAVSSTRPPGMAWAAATAVLALPYPTLKVYWWAGGTLGRGFEGDAEAFPALAVGAFALAAVWGLALVAPWGRLVPRWILTTGAWVAATALVTTGALAGFGTLADVVGLVDGPFQLSSQGLLVGAVYGSWLGLGLCLARAAWPSRPSGRGRDTRPHDAVS